MLISVHGDMGPLCPRTLGGPLDPLHALHNLTLDAFHGAAEKDADGEMSEEVSKSYSAAAHGVFNNRMDLHYEAVNAWGPGDLKVVSVWYFKCRICGLILPAQGPA